MKARLSESSLVEVQLIELQTTFYPSSSFKPLMIGGMPAPKRTRLKQWSVLNAFDSLLAEELIIARE